MTTTPTAHQAAADLAAIREQWGDLLAAIEQRPAAEWPPRETRGFLDKLADDQDQDDAPRVGRLPLVLREHPAPITLDALDAALTIERDLFELCDTIAAAVQRPIRRVPHPARPERSVEDARDRTDPARWHLPTHSASVTGLAAHPGSRVYGLHWAAVWLEGRTLDEDTDAGLFRPLPPAALDGLARVARLARQRLERALGRDGRTTTLDTPCPWCGGQLAGRTRSGGEPVVTCSTGEGCDAPAPLDRGRRTWRGADLVSLWVAMAPTH